MDNCRVSWCCCCCFKGLWPKYQELSYNGVDQKIVINIIQNCINKLLVQKTIFLHLECTCIFCSVSLSHVSFSLVSVRIADVKNGWTKNDSRVSGFHFGDRGVKVLLCKMIWMPENPIDISDIRFWPCGHNYSLVLLVA